MAGTNMKKLLRWYFQLFQDSTLTWGKGQSKYVSSSAIMIGTPFLIIAIPLYLISLVLNPVAKWLSEGE